MLAYDQIRSDTFLAFTYPGNISEIIKVLVLPINLQPDLRIPAQTLNYVVNHGKHDKILKSKTRKIDSTSKTIRQECLHITSTYHHHPRLFPSQHQHQH
jgi:hypothetical protein